MNPKENLPEAKQLLNKYLEGNCSPEEEQHVLRWYYSFTEDDDLPVSNDQQDAILQSIKKRALDVTRGGKKNNRKLGFSNSYLKAAAMIIVLGSAAFFSLYLKNTGKDQATQYLELRAMAGERKTLTLTDGTRVWLNNASVLRYPKKFDGNTREVKLEGEAFFEVVHNKEKPFLVHTQNLHVQVLGTSFDVKSYLLDHTIAVHVATGRVSVSASQNHTLLDKGGKVIYDLKTDRFTQSVSDPKFSREWQNHVFYCRYETLETICRQLERWYGVSITITNKKLLQKRYTLEERSETLENVMKMLCAGEFNYKITGRSVTVW